jgi:hypothetical protein
LYAKLIKNNSSSNSTVRNRYATVLYLINACVPSFARTGAAPIKFDTLTIATSDAIERVFRLAYGAI